MLEQVARLLGAASEGDTFLPVDASDSGGPASRRAASPAPPAQALTFKSVQPGPPAAPPLAYEQPRVPPRAPTAAPDTPSAAATSRPDPAGPSLLRSAANKFPFAQLVTGTAPAAEPARPAPATAPIGAPITAQRETDTALLEPLTARLELDVEVPEAVAAPTADPPTPVPEPRSETLADREPEPHSEAKAPGVTAHELAVPDAGPETTIPPPVNDGPGPRRLTRLHGLGRRRAPEAGALPVEQNQPGEPPEQNQQVEPAETQSASAEVGPVAVAVAEAAAVSETPWTLPVDRGGRFGRIGTTMIERGLITNEQLDDALEVQRTTGRRVGEILVGMGAISRVRARPRARRSHGRPVRRSAREAA